MTQTISPTETPAAESPRRTRPHTDAAGLRAIEDQILAKVNGAPAAG
jgi:hypothetical protein